MNDRLALYTENILRQLTEVLDLLSNDAYKKPLQNLSGSSIGQHTRHIIEFYQCLLQADGKNILDYDNRKRNKLVEENLQYALHCIEEIIQALYTLPIQKILSLRVCYEQTEESFLISTSVERELIYNLEHSVHHMAIIKIGLRELDSEMILPAEFGVAMSTIKHKEKCAQLRTCQ